MNKILIFRPDNIGDVVLFSGALKHIRRRFPDAYITLAVLEHIVDLVELCPYIDKCISLEELNRWYRIEKKHIPFSIYLKGYVRKTDRKQNRLSPLYDMVLYPVKSPLPNHLEIVHDLGVKKTFGMIGCMVNAPKGGYPAEINPANLYSDYIDVSMGNPSRHELFSTLSFLRFLGCDVSGLSDINPVMWLSNSDRNLLENLHLKDRKIIGLFPGASFRGRCWNSENYKILASTMGENVTYVLFGGSEDAKIGQKVKYFLKSGRHGIEIINLIGKTSLRELYKTISACDLFIGMETAGLHLALTAGIPTIGIIGGGHYGRFVPWGDMPERQIFLTKRKNCFHCDWNCRTNKFECIQDVWPEEVANSANKLLRGI